MIRRGVFLATVVLMLAGCAPVGSLMVDAQREPQEDSDMLSAELLPTGPESSAGPSVAPDSVRKLGADDGREFYVASSGTQICLIVIEESASTSACGSGSPTTIAAPGAYAAELWPNDDADHDLSGHWLGEHLWLADRP